MENSYLTQINELLDFLKEKEKRRTVLELLLGLTESEELRKVFLQTEIAKLMIRQLEDVENSERELVLQIIINLSGEVKFAEQFVALNAIYRIVTLFMNKVDLEIKSVNKVEGLEDLIGIDLSYSALDFSKANQTDIKMILDKYVVDTQSMKKNEAGNLLEIPYYFMILTNLTISEEGQKKFLNSEDDTIFGVVFLKVLDKFFQHIYREEFNFCSNLIANACSLKAGRKMLLEDKLFKIFLIHLDKLNNFKLTNILRLIRNCCFEFQTQREEILVNEGILFDYVMKILILTNITDKKELQTIGIANIDDIYFPNFDPKIAMEEKETINDLIVDIFLILTNAEEAVAYMKTKHLYKALKIIGDRLGTDENLKDRLFVINNYLEY